MNSESELNITDSFVRSEIKNIRLETSKHSLARKFRHINYSNGKLKLISKDAS